MRKFLTFAVAALLAFAPASTTQAFKADTPQESPKLAYELVRNTVIIEGPMGGGEYDLIGTGVIEKRIHPVSKRQFGIIWTAAHCLSDYVYVQSPGVIKTDPVAFKVQQFRKSGYPHGGAVRGFGAIVHYDPHRDLGAVLVVDQGILQAVKGSVDYASPVLPPVGTHVVHVGNMLGNDYSYTEGLVSHLRRLDRLSDGGHGVKQYLIQCALTSYGGSSGGGVYNRKGELLGLLIQGYRGLDSFAFVVPTVEMYLSVGQADKEWLMFKSATLPSWSKMLVMVHPEFAEILGE